MALDELLAAQAVLHYVYPLTVFLYFIASSTVAICTLQTSSEAAKTRHRRHKTIYYLLLLFLFCYAAQSILKLAVIVSRHHWPSQDDIIGLLSCILVYGIQQSSLSPARDSTVWYPFYGSWLLGILFEPTIAVLMIISFQGDALSSPTSSASHVSRNPLLWAEVSLYAIRWALLLSVFLTYAIWRNRSESGGCDPEQTPLIPKPNLTSSDANASTDSGYGTNSDSNNTETNNNETTTAPKDAESSWDRRERLAREQIEKRLKSEGSWISYVKGFFIFIPYIWPVGNRRLQTHAALVGVCLLANNGLNFLIPRQYGMVMDSLSGVSGKNPWVQVAIFAGLRLLSSEAGISLIRQLLWLPVEYYSREAMTMAAFSHVMSLSSEFHDSKSTSDTIVAISRGDSISDMLESICFRAIPSIIDLIVAFAYLSAKFGPYEGFITVATGMAFVQASTMIISGFRTQRREVMKSYFEEHYIRQAGIQGWETVTAFNQTAYEENRHRNATKSYVTGVKAMLSRMFIAYAFQYVILLAGLLAGAFLAVYQITHGQATPGDFVMLLSYWSQLTSPLHYFSMLGRKLSQDLIDAERLLELMLTKPTVVNKPNAKTICLKGGKVEFRNVSFSYDKKKDILKGVKLTAPAGTTVAFVGSTGAGKSTILKLLDRFYDVTGGSILIDGQDVRDVTLASLRQCIGIVPQSPILFDDTIMNNIRYARLSATDEEVYSACKAAAVHDQIMGFTEGYMTRVGERGVKLSGGELQRVAIARAILKGPEVVLLDEATSSVDVETEHKIQDGLRNLCRDRTTFIVAHRLSTVVNADVIFVIADGEVVEQGSHENLLAQNGRYADLWSKQAFVRPKDSKAGDVSTETGNPAARNGQTDGPMDNPKAEAQSSSCNPQPGGSTPKPTNAKTAGKANGQVAETPNGHQKEVDPPKDRS
ncbi:hypothetical protein F4778DRAFT_439544 [Xylariomycetidae sp. FL2044]|nr:hypothetical protein F4778DRAFT_439544 [Xylariomycetidae sp. FL2044]